MSGDTNAQAVDEAPCFAGVLPGPALAAELAALDLHELDDHDLLDAIAAWERISAWAARAQLMAVTEFVRRPTSTRVYSADDPEALRATYAPPGHCVREFADDEIAVRLHVSRVAARTKVDLGCALTDLPATGAALARGDIDLTRARVITDEVAPLDRCTAREVEAAVITHASNEPAARLRTRVRRAVVAADPAAATLRGEQARAERRVWFTPGPDGMADVFAELPAVDAVTIRSALTSAAVAMRTNRAPDDHRTMDQLCADALVAPFRRALETGTLDGVIPVRLAEHRGSRATVQVTVAASTLLGHDDSPAQLKGYGTITADVAREVAPDARWRRILTDPRSGTVLDVGTTTYRPPAAMARHVEVRDVLCGHPGCGWPAEACDLDHVVAYPEGPTSAANLRPRCRRHHRFKQDPSVDVTREVDGTVRWTMPTGHIYPVPPAVVGLPIEPSNGSSATSPGPDDADPHAPPF